MASDSLLYTRGYVMPVCSPSLACLFTGLPPHENGITGNDLSGQRNNLSALADQLLSHAPHLPQAVTDAGYLTFQTGKLWNVTHKDDGFTDGIPSSRKGIPRPPPNDDCTVRIQTSQFQD